MAACHWNDGEGCIYSMHLYVAPPLDAALLRKEIRYLLYLL